MEEQTLEITNCPLCDEIVMKYSEFPGLRFCLKCEWFGFAKTFSGIIGDPETYPSREEWKGYPEAGKA